MKTNRSLLALALVLATHGTGCVDNSSAQSNILANLPSYNQYGWTSGAANSGDPSEASYFAITSMVVDGDQVTFSYAWEDGFLSGTVSGNQLVGTWTQANGGGPQQLKFDDSGEFVSGWWADAADPSTHHAAFLLRAAPVASGGGSGSGG